MTPENKTVMITGASTGIGKACALHLDRLDWRVFAGVRKQADVDSLRQESSARLTPVFIDVTDGDSIAAALDTVRQAIAPGGLNGLVNNAGIAKGGPLEFVPIQDLETQFKVNVIGQIAVTQAFLPLLRLNQGRIINMSSISGRVATPFVGPYAASKFALEALTDSLRVELRPWNMEVVSIEPGVIQTPIWDKARNTANQLLDDLPAQAESLYGGQVDILLRVLEETARSGIPAGDVAVVVANALTVSRPKTRYLVGPDAKLGALLVRLLPDRLRDWFIERTRIS